MIDTHCHFDLLAEKTGENRETIIRTMKDSGVTHAVQVSIDPEGFQRSWDLAKQFPDILRFTLGIHPSTESNDQRLDQLEFFVQKVVDANEQGLLFGIGECGLDYFRMHRPRDEQHDSFHRQIDIAKKYDLPLIIHTRDAFEDTLGILKEHGYQKGVFHCFPGDADQARRALDTGFFISYAGNVTFKKAVELHESASYVPTDRIFLETDAPYLSPVPKRGKICRPEYVMHTLNFVAGLQKIDKDLLAQQIVKNVERFSGK